MKCSYDPSITEIEHFIYKAVVYIQFLIYDFLINIDDGSRTAIAPQHSQYVIYSASLSLSQQSVLFLPQKIFFRSDLTADLRVRR